jgi:hypothetical protein
MAITPFEIYSLSAITPVIYSLSAITPLIYSLSAITPLRQLLPYSLDSL